MQFSSLHQCLTTFEKELLTEIEAHAIIKDFVAQEIIVKQGQYIRSLPIVLDGNVKVFTEEEDIPFLLYYISKGDPCIFSFAHVFEKDLSQFSAVAETDSQLLLLPVDKIDEWMKKYSSFNQLILKGYQRHYTDLLNTTKQIICYNLGERLTRYLQQRSELEQSDLLSISHQVIADDLGTSREVITRLMKKLSIDGKVIQVGRKIQVVK